MTELKVSMEIKQIAEDKESSVYFKVDGGRFEKDKTLKLTQDSRYQIKVTVKPASQLGGAVILGQRIEAEEITGNDDSSSVYLCSCNTNGLQASKKNQRMNFPIVLEIKDEGEIPVNLQCKLYSIKDHKHSIWGTPLHRIDMQCNKKEGLIAYSVQEMSFK